MWCICKANTKQYLWDMNVMERKYDFATFDIELPDLNWCMAWTTKEGCQQTIDRIIKLSQYNQGDLEAVEL